MLGAPGGERLLRGAFDPCDCNSFAERFRSHSTLELMPVRMDPSMSLIPFTPFLLLLGDGTNDSVLRKTFRTVDSKL